MIRKIRVKSASRYEPLAGNVDALTNDMDFDFERNKKLRNDKNIIDIEVFEEKEDINTNNLKNKEYKVMPELIEKNLGVRREKRRRMIIRTITYPIILLNDAILKVKDRKEKGKLMKKAKKAKKC